MNVYDVENKIRRMNLSQSNIEDETSLLNGSLTANDSVSSSNKDAEIEAQTMGGMATSRVLLKLLSMHYWKVGHMLKDTDDDVGAVRGSWAQKGNKRTSIIKPFDAPGRRRRDGRGEAPNEDQRRDPDKRNVRAPLALTTSSNRKARQEDNDTQRMVGVGGDGGSFSSWLLQSLRAHFATGTIGEVCCPSLSNAETIVGRLKASRIDSTMFEETKQEVTRAMEQEVTRAMERSVQWNKPVAMRPATVQRIIINEEKAKEGKRPTSDTSQNSAQIHNCSLNVGVPTLPSQRDAAFTTGAGHYHAGSAHVASEKVFGHFNNRNGPTTSGSDCREGKGTACRLRSVKRYIMPFGVLISLMLALGCYGCEDNYRGFRQGIRCPVRADSEKVVYAEEVDMSPISCSIPVQEYEALYDLYNATEGLHWAWRPTVEGAVWNFSSAGSMFDSLAAPCGDSWQGITCTQVGGGNCTITELSLEGYNLRGVLPSSICSLEGLHYFALRINSLTGSIPSSIGQLTALEILALSTNSFTGSIPSSIGQLITLEILFLSTNSLTGLIPSSIGQLTALEIMFLSTNSLTGLIPSSIGQLTALKFMAISINSLTGSIPSSIGQLTALEILFLSTNPLTGPIPPSIGQLTSLLDLYLSSNSLTGTIPSSIGQITALVYLALFANSLTGSIPSSFGRLTALEFLLLSTNSLTGSVPSSIGQHTALNELFLSTNSLTGSIPSSIGQLTTLSDLYLDTNSFSGSLEDLKPLFQLRFLSLNANIFDGSLGAWISSPQAFPHLYLLDLSENAFTGAFPAVVFELRSLRILSASENCFSSLEAVPAVPGRARKSHLQTVQLNGLSSGASCIEYYFHPNSLLPHPGYRPQAYLSQPIPSGLWSLPNLTSLYLKGNGFTGPIDVGNSSSISNALTKVSLANNRLTGPIPMALQQHGKFTTLDLSFNKLSGGVSDSFAVSSAPGSTLAMSVNRLSGFLPSGVLTTYSNDVLSVVQGNIFTFDVASLPPSSLQTASLFNGSEQLDVSMIVSSLLVAIWLSIVIRRCALHRFPLSITSDWWDEMTGSELLALSSDFGVLKEWGRVVTEIMNLCCVMIGLLYGAVALAAVYLVLKLVPPISSSFAVYAEQYSWTLSAAYMHNSAPLVVIMVAVVGSGVWLCSKVVSTRTLTSIRDSQLPLVGIGFHGTLKGGLFISVLVNGVVMLGINVGYVLAVIRNTPSLVMIQVAVALFKSVWCALYPRVTIMLSNRLKERGLVSQSINDDLLGLHSYLMTVLVFNIVVAPCIATALSDTACYYNVFVQQPSSVITTQVPCAGDYFIQFDGASSLELGCGSTNASNTVADDLSGTYYPPFIYSYQCGSALVTNYVPVLVYIFFLSGFVRPLLDMVVLLNSEWVGRSLPQWATGMLFSPVYHLHHQVMKVDGAGDDEGVVKISALSDQLLASDGPEHGQVDPTQSIVEVESQVPASPSSGDSASSKGPAPMFDAPSAMTRLVLHVVVMLTFGLAAPYLGVVVVCSFFSEVAMLRLVLGRYVHLAHQTYHEQRPHPTSSNAAMHDTFDGHPSVEFVASVNLDKMAPSSVSAMISRRDAATSSPLSEPSSLLHEPTVTGTREDGHGSRRAGVMRELEWTVRGVWRYPSHSAGAVVIVTGLFWGLLSFDMIADVYGDGAGYATMTMVMVGTPLVTYLVTRAAMAVGAAIVWTQLQPTSTQSCNDNPSESQTIEGVEDESPTSLT